MKFDEKQDLYGLLKAIGDGEEALIAWAKRREQERISRMEELGSNKLIKMEDVVQCLKFIIENDSKIADFFIPLKEKGFVFSLEDVYNQFPQTKAYFDDIEKLDEDMKKGFIGAGAFIIVGMRDASNLRYAFSVRYLDHDDETSAYNFIRVVTGDLDYTRENILPSKKTR